MTVDGKAGCKYDYTSYSSYIKVTALRKIQRFHDMFTLLLATETATLSKRKATIVLSPYINSKKQNKNFVLSHSYIPFWGAFIQTPIYSLAI
jgi:hypothetical protein